MSKLYWQNTWNFELNYSSNILFIIESEKCIYSYNNLRKFSSVSLIHKCPKTNLKFSMVHFL